jgi:hypothetical protein
VAPTETVLQESGFREQSPGVWQQCFGHDDIGLTWTLRIDLAERVATATRGLAMCDQCTESAFDLMSALGCPPAVSTGTDGTLRSYSQPF